MEAAKALYDHYAANGETLDFQRWELWLAERGYVKAMSSRAERQFSKAFDFPLGSSERLEALQEARGLMDKLAATDRSLDEADPQLRLLETGFYERILKEIRKTEAER